MTPWGKARMAAAVWLGLSAPAVPAADVHQTQVDQTSARYTARVVSTMYAPLRGVSAVLTDFNHLEKIHRSVVSSEHLAINADGSDRVRVEMRDCVLLFCTDMLHIVDFTRSGPGVITAVVDGERSDFRYGRLSWHLTESVGAVGDPTPRTHLVFRAEIEPAFWVPPLVGPVIVKKKLRDLAVGISHNLERGAAGKGP